MALFALNALSTTLFLYEGLNTIKNRIGTCRESLVNKFRATFEHSILNSLFNHPRSSSLNLEIFFYLKSVLECGLVSI